MSSHTLIFEDDFTEGTIRQVFAQGRKFDDVDPPVRILREVLCYADAPGQVCFLEILPGGTGTTIDVLPTTLEREPITSGGKQGFRVKFTQDTEFKVVTTATAARNELGLLGDLATIKTRVMIKFPPGLDPDALEDESVVADLDRFQFKVSYTDGSSQTYSGNTHKTKATGEKHEATDPPARTIGEIEYVARSTSDTFSLTVMPAGTDTKIEFEGVDSTEVKEGSKSGRKATFTSTSSALHVVTQDTDVAGDRRIPTTVKIKFPSGDPGDPAAPP